MIILPIVATAFAVAGGYMLGKNRKKVRQLFFGKTGEEIQQAFWNGDFTDLELVVNYSTTLADNPLILGLAVGYGAPLTLIKTILSKDGCKVNEQDNLHATPLFFAARDHRFEVVRLLLDAGADVNIGASALEAAVASCSLPTTLKQARKYIGAEQTDGLKCVHLLLKANPCPNMNCGYQGDNILFHCLHVPFEIFMMLVEAQNLDDHKLRLLRNRYFETLGPFYLRVKESSRAMDEEFSKDPNPILASLPRTPENPILETFLLRSRYFRFATTVVSAKIIPRIGKSSPFRILSVDLFRELFEMIDFCEEPWT